MTSRWARSRSRSPPGPAACSRSWLKSWLSVQVALLLAFTTPFHDLIDALRALRLPRIMVSIISFMYRYLAVLTDEARRMNRAKAARSAVVTGRAGGSHPLAGGVTGSMVGSLFLRSYERSERIYAAMLARGFQGQLPGDLARPSTAALGDAPRSRLDGRLVPSPTSRCLRGDTRSRDPWLAHTPVDRRPGTCTSTPTSHARPRPRCMSTSHAASRRDPGAAGPASRPRAGSWTEHLHFAVPGRI